MQNNLIVREAQIEDAGSLLAVYAPYVRETAVTFEYDVPSEDEFSQRIKNIKQNYPYLVAEMNQRIVGYAYAGVFRNRAAYAWTAETTIYISKESKRSGIGKRLYTALGESLACQGITNLVACIAYPSTEDEFLSKDSFYFHQKMGYELAGRFHKCGFKFNRWYDMIYMEKIIGEHGADQPSPRPFSGVRNGVAFD